MDEPDRGDPIWAAGSGVSSPFTPTRQWVMTAQEQDMMSRFRQDFLDLLDSRVAKIVALIGTGQIEPAHVGLLSLESSSTMLGLHDLADATRRLRSALQQIGDAELATLLDDVSEQARRAHGAPPR